MIKYLHKSVLKKSSLINLKKYITLSTETVEVLGFRCFKCDGEEGKRDGGIAVQGTNQGECQSCTRFYWRVQPSRKVWVELKNKKGEVNLTGLYYRPPNSQRNSYLGIL